MEGIIIIIVAIIVIRIIAFVVKSNAEYSKMEREAIEWQEQQAEKERVNRIKNIPIDSRKCLMCKNGSLYSGDPASFFDSSIPAAYFKCDRKEINGIVNIRERIGCPYYDPMSFDLSNNKQN